MNLFNEAPYQPKDLLVQQEFTVCEDCLLDQNRVELMRK